VETAFNDQISRANIGHGPLMLTSVFAHRYSRVWSKKLLYPTSTSYATENEVPNPDIELEN
jgi:hypothetical protein